MSQRILAAMALVLVCAGLSWAQPSFDDHYLILTNDDMAPVFADLSEFRASQGYTAEVVTLAEALDAVPALEDDAATLRSYLAQRHAAGTVDLVLLGGNADVIPVRIIDDAHLTSRPIYPADLYYACLDGTWNADGDSLYADPDDDPDVQPELAVGRAPVSTVAEARVLVDKVLAHEASTDASRHRALLAGAVLLPYDWQPGDPFQYDAAAGCELAVPVFDGLPEPMAVTRMYQNDADYEGAVELTIPALLDTLATGRHGYVDLSLIVDGDFFQLGYETFSSAELLALPDEGRAPVVQAMYGGGANFASDSSVLVTCLLEEGGGFVAAVGMSATPYIMYVDQLRAGFHEALALGDDPRLGRAWQRSLMAMADDVSIIGQTCMREYTLLGDPALTLWTDQAVAIEDGDEQDLQPVTAGLRLSPCYPNPFNPQTNVAFSLERREHVRLTVHDLRGRCLRTLLDESRPAGSHSLVWDGRDGSGRSVASGSYLMRITAGHQIRHTRATIVK